MYVTTLLANPELTPINDAEVNAVVDALTNQGAFVTSVAWLERAVACDIYFDKLPLDDARETLAHLLAAVPFDAITQEKKSRRKKLLVSDMDSTIITIECIDELADYAGLKEKVAAITERAMNGELDFVAALNERVALLAGMPESVLQECYDSRVKLMPGAEALVKTMAANGASTVLISGGFTFFTSRVAKAAGFEEHVANVLDVKDGKLTGKVKPPIVDKHVKKETLLARMDALGLGRDETLAAGDGANDLPMLLSSGLGVAFHAKPSVKAEAVHKIDHCDLSALLYAQGYVKRDFIL